MNDTTCSTLKTIRLKYKKTQQELANIMGVHVNSYYLYETEQIEMPVSKAKKLAEYLKIDWWTLYENEED